MEIPVQCPYCLEIFQIENYYEDGEKQNFTYDCEVCCHPIEIEVDYTFSKDQPLISLDRSVGV